MAQMMRVVKEKEWSGAGRRSPLAAPRLWRTEKREGQTKIHKCIELDATRPNTRVNLENSKPRERRHDSDVQARDRHGRNRDGRRPPTADRARLVASQGVQLHSCGTGRRPVQLVPIVIALRQ